ncbi:unnamed protein product [Lactuca saligna]|uniref:TF-B3 domain-containing protein n=1 Tax=Lactuca saligna TaxID=75948 RepID=A0AA36EEI6_LACSI|nr:unnamed protein product [Lactuca saligna]
MKLRLEASFLNSYSKAEIVDMLRKHTYSDDLEQNSHPSDVRKVNWLVIPKQHVKKHFPLQSGSTSKRVLLHFEDIGMKVWRFRDFVYSYFNSIQSYVLTKGWSQFVKENNLKAGDIVSFQRSAGLDKQLTSTGRQKTGQVAPIFKNKKLYKIIKNGNGAGDERY